MLASSYIPAPADFLRMIEHHPETLPLAPAGVMPADMNHRAASRRQLCQRCGGLADVAIIVRPRVPWLPPGPWWLDLCAGCDHALRLALDFLPGS